MSGLRQRNEACSSPEDDVEDPKVSRVPSLPKSPSSAPAVSPASGNAPDSFAAHHERACDLENSHRPLRLDEHNQANELNPIPTRPGPQHRHATASTTATLGRRQVKRDAPLEECAKVLEGKDDRIEAAAAASDASATEFSAAPPGFTRNPLLLVRIILRKVIALITLDDDDNYFFAKPVGAVVLFIKDVTIGLLYGMAIISALVVLDSLGVVRIRSAHRLLAGALPSGNDAETIATIEEHSYLKLMPMIIYEDNRREIDGLDDKLATMKASLESQLKSIERARKEMGHAREELDRLMAHPLIGLDGYCGKCKWSRDGRVSCDARAEYLVDTYKTGPLAAKINVMGHPSCKNKR